MASKFKERRDELSILRKIEQSARVKRGLAKLSGLRQGIGDDAALWVPRRGYETILTTDWFLEGRHFLRNVHPPDATGWKCLARALSDVAAMGGEPRCCLASLALPSDCSTTWLSQYMKGLSRAARELRCPIAGGDTTKSSQILINVCVLGEVRPGIAVTRSGAKPGDRIFVSGTLGEAELGLKTLNRKNRIERPGSILRKHLYPTPRIALGSWLASNGLAAAMMDLSDGLSSDLARLCKASGVGARLFGERLPVAEGPFARRFNWRERFHAALHGGDDYELLFCVKKNMSQRIPRTFSGIRLTEIGEISRENEITLLESSGKTARLEASGWDPFRK